MLGRLGFFRILKRISLRYGALPIRLRVRLPLASLKNATQIFYSGKTDLVIILMIIFLAFMQSMRYGVLFLSRRISIMIAEYAIKIVSGFQYWFDYLDHGQDPHQGKTLRGSLIYLPTRYKGHPLLQNNMYLLFSNKC